MLNVVAQLKGGFVQYSVYSTSHSLHPYEQYAWNMHAFVNSTLKTYAPLREQHINHMWV